MIELSKDTEALVEALFPSQKVSENLKTRLRKECADNIPSCKGYTPQQMERIRFALIKLCYEQNGQINNWFSLAKIDLPDLFNAAGFGYEPNEHKTWKDQILKSI